MTLADPTLLSTREQAAYLERPAVRAALWIAWGVFTLAFGLLYANRPPSPDLATFDYVGWMLSSQGGTLYVDVIEQNWPGAIWLHTLSTSLFGNQLWSFRVLDYGLLCIGALSLFGLLKRAGRPLAGWLVMPVHQAMYVAANIWFIGQRDVVGAHLLLVAALAYLMRMQGGPRLWVLPLGVGTTFVTLIRPTYLLFPVLLLVADALLAKRNGRSLRTVFIDMLTAGAASLSLLALIGIWAADSGALSGWWSAAVLFNTQLYSHSASFGEVTATILSLRKVWHWYIAFAALGAVCWWKRGERNVLAILACFFVLALVSIYVQRKGFGYHIAGAWIVVFSALTAELMAWSIAWARQRRSLLALGTALAICGVVGAGLAKKAYGSLEPQLRYLAGTIDQRAMHEQVETGVDGMTVQDLVSAAQFAREQTRPDQTVLVWSRAIAICFLAQRQLPTPFATVGALEVLRPPFAPTEAWLSDFEQTLQHAPPALVFAPGPKVPEEHTRLFEDADAPRATRALRKALASRYAKVATFGSMDAYVRDDLALRSGT